MTQALPRHGVRASGREYAASKVPVITVYFWIVKLLTTAMGEATTDYLAHAYNPYLVVPLGGIGLAIALAIQFRTERYVTWVYWLTVVMVAIFGTMAADSAHIVLHVPYLVSTLAFGTTLAVIFVLWQRSEKTLSIHSICTRRREMFYWATVLATFALGTAAGDMTARTLGLGFLSSVVLFAVVIAIPAIGYWKMGMNSVLAFWFAYVVTRPLGASLADYFGIARRYSGMGLGYGMVAVILTFLVIGFVGYLAVTGKDVEERRDARFRYQPGGLADGTFGRQRLTPAMIHAVDPALADPLQYPGGGYQGGRYAADPDASSRYGRSSLPGRGSVGVGYQGPEYGAREFGGAGRRGAGQGGASSTGTGREGTRRGGVGRGGATRGGVERGGADYESSRRSAGQYADGPGLDRVDRRDAYRGNADRDNASWGSAGRDASPGRPSGREYRGQEQHGQRRDAPAGPAWVRADPRSAPNDRSWRDQRDQDPRYAGGQGADARYAASPDPGQRRDRRQGEVHEYPTGQNSDPRYTADQNPRRQGRDYADPRYAGRQDPIYPGHRYPDPGTESADQRLDHERYSDARYVGERYRDAGYDSWHRDGEPTQHRPRHGDR